jgi:hypothetical protein
MTAGPLTKQLHQAGISCRALANWERCGDGREDRCEKCFLDGPEKCDGQVIGILVKQVVNAVGHTDEALDQRDYWKGVVDRLTAVVMASESTRATAQRRQR